MTTFKTIITGSGCFIPDVIKANQDFVKDEFYAEDQQKIDTPPEIIVQKFQQITGIAERRYANEKMQNSDMGTIAGRLALEDSKVDPETIDQLIVAHNYGNVIKNTIQCDTVPSIASRIKYNLGIKNPSCVAYDVLFGCPGWLQGVIQADAFFKAGIAKKALVIGTETLSRVIDPYDRDSMIFSDGAGAFVLEKSEENSSSGILSASVQSHCIDEMEYINMGKSYYPDADPKVRYIKMKGRKVYEYAMKNVPLAMKDCLEKANIGIDQLDKVFLHQANEKMDDAIIRELYKLYNIKVLPKNIMPMSIGKLGNSSVATIPTLYDMVKRGQMSDHDIKAGDIILFASVGAGMNINAVCYRI